MNIGNSDKRLEKAINKELRVVAKKEEKYRIKACSDNDTYKDKLKTKIPRGLNNTLETAFLKAFGIIFKHGVGVIEKGYDKDEIAVEYDVQNYAVDKKGSRKELKKLRKSARKSDLLNLSITTVEGVGLGALGIGLPDIVLFIGMILKGIYEVSLKYGYEYDSAQEKYLILTMMKTALAKGEDWIVFNSEVDDIISSPYVVSEEALKGEVEETSKVFATDMMVLKFIQGIPIVGVIGGIFNPVYYSKIMKYVRLKYHKRYLLDKQRQLIG